MRIVLGLVIAAVVSLPALAREMEPAERREYPAYNANLPGCDNSFVLGEISDKFRTREDRFWSSDLRIVSFERVRETGWRPWGVDFIPRRFCTALVTTTDGIKRRIDYSVREGTGFIGLSWGTDWCIDGLDRNYAYAPHCRQARP